MHDVRDPYTNPGMTRGIQIQGPVYLDRNPCSCQRRYGPPAARTEYSVSCESVPFWYSGYPGTCSNAAGNSYWLRYPRICPERPYSYQ
eukprot:3595123-Rhodomonas_salina.1